MAAPEYLVCVECEAYCYTFEYKEGQVVEALCETCGNDAVDQFLSEDDFEALLDA